jgi:hypothetical protein
MVGWSAPPGLLLLLLLLAAVLLGKKGPWLSCAMLTTRYEGWAGEDFLNMVKDVSCGDERIRQCILVMWI